MKLAAFLLGTVLFLSVPRPACATDWPQWRGPNRDGVSRDKNWSAEWPASGPAKLWRAEIGVGYGSMAVANGKVYVMGNTADTDHVFCFDAQTGKQIWKHSYPCPAKDPNGYPGPRGTPTVHGKFVYSVSREGHLFCLDANNGNVIWQKDYQADYNAKPPQWGFSTSPLVVENIVIAETGAPGASTVAFEKNSGKEIWKVGDDEAGYSSPVSFTHKGQPAIAIFTAKTLVARSLKDGAELWRIPWKTSYDVNAATPIIHGNTIFISSGYGVGCALYDFSKAPPVELWRNKKMKNQVNSSVLWDGFLYGFDGQAGRGFLKCLDFKTGEEKWEHEGFGTGSVIVADGKLIIYGDKGQLATAEATPADFEEISRAQPVEVRKDLPRDTKGDTWALPVLANGMIYLRNLDEIVCLDVRAK
ncbi:MAG: PQQ-binding-like beta-propeller repeat protein [Verrucomicrobia bacterium]|nr:PQQ-binding-like beta-propeller repeat protein [Verrucomicrobiota bacterium]